MMSATTEDEVAEAATGEPTTGDEQEDPTSRIFAAAMEELGLSETDLLKQDVEEDVLEESEDNEQVIPLNGDAGDAALNFDHFAIDSDGEEEDDNGGEARMVDPLLHPPTDTTDTKTTTTTTGSGTPTNTSSTAASTDTSANSSFASHSNSTADAIKKRTGMFARGLGEMAARAAQTINTVGETTNKAIQSSIQQATHLPHTPQQQHHQQQHPLTRGSSMPSSSPSSLPPTSSSSTLSPELDQETKRKLIRTYMGDLLEGERVIMFLSNLLHVSDSSLLHHQVLPSSANGGGMWCCCMTFYRLVLFLALDHGTTTSPTTTGGSGAIANSNNVSVSGPRRKELPPYMEPHLAASSLSPQAEYYLTHHRILEMPLASVDKVEKSIYSITLRGHAHPTTLMGLVVHGKDNGRQIRFTTPSYGDTVRAHESLQTYAFPGRRNLGYLFAFESRRAEVMASLESGDGNQSGGNAASNPAAAATAAAPKKITSLPTRKFFQPVEEFSRQGALREGGPWFLQSQINAQYNLCMSYPNQLMGPIGDSTPEDVRLIRKCASFRSEGRMPALTWASNCDGASLWRCAQPKVGLQGNRSQADEAYLQKIQQAAAAANQWALSQGHVTHLPSKAFLQHLTGGLDLLVNTGRGNASSTEASLAPTVSLKILDMRPKSSAIANRTGGYGYENISNYPGATLEFFNIGNIHAVRDSYSKMSALCLNPAASDVQFSLLLEETKWLNLVRHILSASWQSAFHIHFNRLPVLLHCSHGWDRTSQVAALAQLLLDPYYRSMEGFATLVEKDFLSFGHPFHTRCAHGEGKGDNAASGAGDDTQMAPIFIQFLDCVYQLVAQYPEYFEITPDYLLKLAENVYSCRFGTLLCDTERERELVAGIRQRTHSLWDYLMRECPPSAMYNKSYQGILLMPHSTLMRNVKLWTGLHCKHGPKATGRKSLLDRALTELVDLKQKYEALVSQQQQRQQPDLAQTPVRVVSAKDDETTASNVETANTETATTEPIAVEE